MSVGTQEQNLVNELRMAGLKSTRSRKAILSILIQKHGPHTTEQIHQQLKPGLCDLVTVYRCLETFELKGLVRSCHFGDGMVRYEYSSGKHHHHHIVCRQCREVREIDRCLLVGVEKHLAKQGYFDITHSLEFFGTCQRCATQ